MAILPAKFLSVVFSLGNATATVPSGQWTGYPYQWDANLSVSAQPHGSDETLPTPFSYDGYNVEVGDCIVTSGGGTFLKIVSITSQDSGTVACVVEDWNFENIYQDPTQSGSGAISDGEGYLFSVVEGMPILHPLPDALAGVLPPYFEASILMRFMLRKQWIELEVNQTAHGFSVNDAIFLNSAGAFEKAVASNVASSNVVGIVTLVGVPDENRFRYRPVKPIVSVAMPAGDPGSVIYLSDSVAGGLTTDSSMSNKVPLFIKVSDTSGVLIGNGIGLGWLWEGIQATPEDVTVISSSGGVVSLDFSSKINVLTLTENVAITVPNMTGWKTGAVERIDLYVVQTGAWTVTWTGWKAVDGVAPENSLVPATDRFVIDCLKDIDSCSVGLAQKNLVTIV